MKILIVSEVYPSIEKPQYGVFIKQQFDELSKLGNEIEVLTPIRSKRNGKLDKSVFEGKTVYKVEYCVNRYELFLRHTEKSVYLQIEQLIRQNSYDLISLHITGDTILKIFCDIARKANLPIIVHYHGLNVFKEFYTKHKIREKFYAFRRKKILENAKAIIGVSDKVSSIVREKFANKPVYTVYNGVETKLFYPEEDKEEKFTIIGVGNLIAIKGFKYLIEAFSKVSEKNPDVRLKIAGEGMEREYLENLSKEKGVGEYVSFLGKIPYEDVAKQMRNSHLFVLPSFYEALGCVYLEAMACGVPTIGVKGMGIDEIIKDGENGLLVEQKNVDSIVEQIEKVINDKNLAIKLGENGRETALKYTWKASAENLDAIYKKYLG